MTKQTEDPSRSVHTNESAEQDLRHAELSVKRLELRARRAAAARDWINARAPWWRKADPLVLAIAAGTLTLFGNLAVAVYNGATTRTVEAERSKNALNLEKAKNKVSLILQAVSTNDAQTAQRNILFFLDAGLLKDDDKNRIRNAASKYSPVLPSQTGAVTPVPIDPEGYETAFWSSELRPELVAEIDRSVDKIVENRSRLETVGRSVKVPWYVIGALVMLETTGRFDSHLHNGDPLTGKTVRVPKGRPPIWPPPAGVDPWVYSAEDALGLANFTQLDEQRLGEVLFRLEQYNGLGMRARGLPSPYLWSGTTFYVRGKWIGDNILDVNAISHQIGAAAILRRMHDRKIIDLKAAAASAAQP